MKMLPCWVWLVCPSSIKVCVSPERWGFLPKGYQGPRYLCCNADESEPGTFKDHVLMERNPHLLFEGCLIGCHAIGAKVAYIYIRGEFYHVQLVLEAELAKARSARSRSSNGR